MQSRFLKVHKTSKRNCKLSHFFPAPNRDRISVNMHLKLRKKITFLKIFLFNQITTMICTFFGSFKSNIMNSKYHLSIAQYWFFFLFFNILLYAFVFEEKFFSFLFLVVYTNTIELNKIKKFAEQFSSCFFCGLELNVNWNYKTHCAQENVVCYFHLPHIHADHWHALWKMECFFKIHGKWNDLLDHFFKVL